MGNYSTYRLSDIMEIIGGGTPKTSVASYWNGAIPWLSVVDFNNDNRWVYETEKSITQEGLQNSSTKLLNAGDIIISARGTVGALAQLGKPMAFNQSCYGLRAKENLADQDFLYYLLKINLQQLLHNTHGAVFDTITRTTFENILVNLPPLPEQKRIAHILSTFDKKIELLQKQNKTLEAIAQTLYKRWFVDFEFPNAGDDKSYKSSGGKMVSSELGEIPEGWEVEKLGNEFEIVMGQSPPGTSYNENGDGMIFFQGRAEFDERFPKTRFYTTDPKRIAEKFDVLVSVRAPVGDINVAFSRCCIGRGLGAVRGQFKSYTLYKVQSLQDTFQKFESQGTVFGSMNKDNFGSITVIIPNDKIVEEFEKKCYPIDQKIFVNSQSIQGLSLLRDKLLIELLTPNHAAA